MVTGMYGVPNRVGEEVGILDIFDIYSHSEENIRSFTFEKKKKSLGPILCTAAKRSNKV